MSQPPVMLDIASGILRVVPVVAERFAALPDAPRIDTRRRFRIRRRRDFLQSVLIEVLLRSTERQVRLEETDAHQKRPAPFGEAPLLLLQCVDLRAGDQTV